jgi:hypothetical protein
MRHLGPEVMHFWDGFPRAKLVIAEIITSKLPDKWLPCRVEACGSGSVFITRTSRFNKLKALSRLRGALQPAPRFLWSKIAVTLRFAVKVSWVFIG